MSNAAAASPPNPPPTICAFIGLPLGPGFGRSFVPESMSAVLQSHANVREHPDRDRNGHLRPGIFLPENLEILVAGMDRGDGFIVRKRGDHVLNDAAIVEKAQAPQRQF